MTSLMSFLHFVRLKCSEKAFRAGGPVAEGPSRIRLEIALDVLRELLFKLHWPKYGACHAER